MKKFLSVLVAFLIIASFGGCAFKEQTDENDPPKPIEEIPDFSESGGRKEVSPEGFEDAFEIVLSENGVTFEGKPAEESDFLEIGGEIVYYRDIENYESGNVYGEGEKKDRHTETEAAEYTLVTITKPGEYFIKGEMKGQLAVDLGKEAKNDPEAKVKIIFGGADINCKIAPAVIFYNVYECGTDMEKGEHDTSDAGANIVIADGSVNNITGAYVAKIFKDKPGETKLHKYDAALYSKMSLNISGGEENSGILNIYGENEGLGTEMHLTFDGGIVSINSQNDGINTNEDGVSVTMINGGKLTVKGGLGEEGDGIDSNGWLIINGGEIYASGNGKSADGGIDADEGIYINGGKVVASGARNDFVNEESAQPFLQLDFSKLKEAGSKIELLDESGKVFSGTIEREFKSVVVSGFDIREGGTYSLFIDGILQDYFSEGKAIEHFKEEAAPEIIPGIRNEIPGEFVVPEDPNKHENSTHSFSPGITNDIMVPETDKNQSVFAVRKGKTYFSGIHDSSSVVGKEYISFTINGKDRFEDIYVGDIPEIEEIGYPGKIPLREIEITLESASGIGGKNIFKNCLLSEGLKKVEGLFEGLEPGSYRLTIAVSEKNEKYTGSTVFNFDVVD